MHIQRIQVPDFRALKNVDISFEKEFTPRIFPIGSQNGGGKSTLLQLIFVLLHCAGNPDRVEFIQNLLDGFHVNDESGKRTLAIIDIWDGRKTVRLDFFICNKKVIDNFLLEDYKTDTLQIFKGTIHNQIRKTNINIHELNFKTSYLEDGINIINTEKDNEETDIIETILEEIHRIKQYILDIGISIDDKLDNFIKPTKDNISDLLSIMEKALDKYYICIDKTNIEKKYLEDILNKVIGSLEQRKTIYLCDLYTGSNNKNTDEVLLCQTNNDNEDSKKLLNQIDKNIFLSSHISQVFLFLPLATRKLLLNSQINKNNYYLELQNKKNELPGLFTYDFLAVDTIIKAFKDARDKDFRQAILTGDYGNSYNILLNKLHSILGNKKVNITPDFSGVNFKLDSDGTELDIEDLSHGELKRLCIYTWMKHNNIKDAIVLMDELEISFHPDWQYQIVRDLEEWGATNQYILATHSYELCNAVTPAHVKELDPKLQARTIQ